MDSKLDPGFIKLMIEDIPTMTILSNLFQTYCILDYIIQYISQDSYRVWFERDKYMAVISSRLYSHIRRFPIGWVVICAFQNGDIVISLLTTILNRLILWTVFDTFGQIPFYIWFVNDFISLVLAHLLNSIFIFYLA